ncbi:LysR family transcriptional regulator [Agarivorans sp. B2Z047]|uniref:LysR family transcriptional regulator n=1 Tax=Agarivorans sp. B2Z047 TaxID=2652721 RepID=UPI00128C31BB|nr:LysR family transcriptional regulator [Agarivorans sp. B2Z047]MPW30196.1 LysR family transcriptional regulator [Agarivorans sp. B2Z047]UQN43175.1 LysR family transcriptional regulator [Agarivorans sp. B2Z047]
MNAHKNDWNDIHIAYKVATLGTLTAAAEALDVHHSTVLRRINALEERLGTRLFHRHARGYQVTEAGLLLTQTAESTQNDFNRLLGKLAGTDNQLSGTLVLTTVNNMAELLLPMLAEFQALYPNIKLEYAADSRILKLEHGEAHVSIRPGKKPKDLDYVVQHLADTPVTLYGSSAYLKKYGKIKSLNEVAGHKFISTIEPYSQISFINWMNSELDPQQIALRVNDFNAFIPAIKAGFGAAPLNCETAKAYPDLLPLMAPPEHWAIPQWLTTHVDMHRTSKVQAFTQFLKQRFNALAN